MYNVVKNILEIKLIKGNSWITVLLKSVVSGSSTIESLVYLENQLKLSQNYKVWHILEKTR